MKLIPTPKAIDIQEGFFLLDCPVLLEKGCDKRLEGAAAHIARAVYEYEGKSVRISHGTAGDGYTLDICEKGIEIVGQGASGAFYGIQTLRQLINEYGVLLPVVHIEDKPDFKERGFYHDVTRGKVPKLEMLYKIADELAYIKINQLQLYVEDAYDFSAYKGIIPSDSLLTKEEILALDNYCYENFIELVPSLSTFGHLYNLLQSEKYKHLCELEDYTPRQHYWIEKMMHHTIDVSNPESIELIGSMIDEYIPLFRSDKVNICCDETFDLCKGRNKGKDSGEEYVSFLLKIIERVRSHGKKVQMWGDILTHHPDKIDAIPKDVVMLNWKYSKEPGDASCPIFENAGYEMLVCPGTSTWNRFVENADVGLSNISAMAALGKKHHAIGLLNTNWGDYGNVCSWYSSQMGIMMGAERAWTADNDISLDEFKLAVDSLAYNTDEKVCDVILQLSYLEEACPLDKLVRWYSQKYIEKKQGIILDVNIDKAKDAVSKCSDIISSAEEFNKISADARDDIITAAMAIRFMSRIALCIKGEAKAPIEELAELKIKLRQVWLRDNKLSQLERVCSFFDDLIACSLE